jgi:hypothetical protein
MTDTTGEALGPGLDGDRWSHGPGLPLDRAMG